MRILGIDYGDRRIGLAVSDPLGITAQTIGHYTVDNAKADKEYFTKLTSEYNVERIVIGLPLKMDGTPGTRVEKTKAFAAWLGEFLDVPIVFWDERLTTKQAIGILHEQNIRNKGNKALKDQVSAVLILSNYLESLRNEY